MDYIFFIRLDIVEYRILEKDVFNLGMLFG